MCKIFNDQDVLIGVFLVTACNEVVTFTDIKTGEILFKIFDEQAIHGYVTCLQASSDLIAIGYSSGSILVYRLKLQEQENMIEKVHQFTFHRSPVTAVEFFNDNTQMASGSNDTYIIVYDLIADTAQFKLLGHNESITKLTTIVFKHPVRGNDQTLLISGAKDGLLKFWDIEQQSCILNTSDQYLSKIETFVMIPELNLIIAGSSDNQLKIFKLQQNGDTGALECNFKTIIKKDSGSRVIELAYEKSLQQLMILSSDSKLEVIKVNIDNKDSILKKLIRQEKRKALKRKREDADEVDDDAIPSIKIDKEELQKLIDTNSYDLGLHFSKRLAFDLDQKSKARSFFGIPMKTKAQNTVLKIFVAFHSNQVVQYRYEPTKKVGEKELNVPEIEKVFGAMESHKLPIRGVQIAENDGILATHSFDCVKIWKIDFSAQQEELKLQCSHSIDQINVTAVLILPGNKYILLGTKEGALILYDL